MSIIFRLISSSWGYLSAFLLGSQTVEKDEENPQSGFFNIKGWMIFAVVIVLIVWIMKAMKWTIPNPFAKSRRYRAVRRRVTRFRRSMPRRLSRGQRQRRSTKRRY